RDEAFRRPYAARDGGVRAAGTQFRRAGGRPRHGCVLRDAPTAWTAKCDPPTTRDAAQPLNEVPRIMNREPLLAKQPIERLPQLARRPHRPLIAERQQRLRRPRLVLEAHLALPARKRLQRALQRRDEIRPRVPAAPSDRDSPRMLLDLV